MEPVVSTADTTNLVRVEKGEASDEEVAAVTALLLARAASAQHGAGPAGRPRRSTAGWRRLERTPGFRAPHSWQG
ncbi:acyl-CoA carboxylase epsilon subunit [Streptomyces sp. 549]|uniref:acyl-CoA carboxylase epsilon subunit n=1 Tax=Streptomyces sp. 549 TaxID=3049076 RepID=UPI0024C26635|nr:acyl-CoA carboxylase epsilon subunit [Streptomyces sp. 549]MDK1476105.1 acyl-CoA carboxylase epsilon subunit [Streptomyces sp. 549]